MTLGEKIKKARTENGFTQGALAEKLMVSRQAVTKWEADKGMPDVGNLKLLAQLLNVSVDYLLDSGETEDMNVIRENIDLSKYGKARTKTTLINRLMRDKFPKAEIHALSAKKERDKADKIIDEILNWTTSAAPSADLLNSMKMLGTMYYLAIEEGKAFFVTVNYKEGFMETRRMAEHINPQPGEKFTIGDITFTDCGIRKQE